HGSYRITYANIDLGKLVTVSEEDIFIPNYKKPLTEIIINRLMDHYNVSVPDSLISLGFFNLDEVFPNNNFWLDNEGIHYSFNQYEIAPYSMGVINVDIPYGDLSAVLKPENVTQKFFLKNASK
ncbi:MAG TPA: RsiV family protein, partial [Petrimonas sp.]|nr:RsiV family protein [Petrimonas sp.]